MMWRELWRRLRPPRKPAEPTIADELHRDASTLLARERVPSEDDVAALERRHRVYEIQVATRPPPPPTRARNISIGLFAIAGLTIVLLMTIRRGTTEIELEVTTSDVTFTSTGDLPVLREVQLARAAIRGIQDVDYPPTLPAPTTPLVTQPGDGGVFVASTTAPPSEIASAPVRLPRGTTASVAVLDEAPETTMVFIPPSGTSVEMVFTLTGAVQLGDAALAFDGDAIGVLTTQGAPVQTQLTLLADGALFAPAIPIHGLAFVREDDASQTGRVIAVRSSGISAGTIVLGELAGKQLEILDGEFLDLGCARGYIRRLRRVEGTLTLRFHGTVCELSAGHGAQRRDLMPTYLEWLTAQEPLKVLWISTFWLFGVAIALLRWWRKPG